MNPFKNQVDLKNSTSRNAFDLSKRVLFSAKPGELLPVYHKTLMPGDNFHINLKHFSRTLPIVSAPFTSIKEYYDFFFVPYKMLWNQADQAFTRNSDNSQIATSPTSEQKVSSTVPYISLSRIFKGENNVLKILNKKKNFFGFNRAYCAQKLLNMLGYPYIDNTMLSNILSDKYPSGAYSQQASALPLLAYHKIYYDFYRNSRWENSKAYLFNADYASNGAVYFPSEAEGTLYYNQDTLLDLHYSDYARDLVQSLLPSRQLGDTATFESTSDGKITSSTNGKYTVTFNNGRVSVPLSTAGYLSNQVSEFVNTNSQQVKGFTNALQGDNLTASVDISSAISNLQANIKTTTNVLDLRNAMFLQRYREILGTGNLDFANIVQKIYGTDQVLDYVDTVKYLGGNSGFIEMQTQTNSNFTNDVSQADLRSTGTGNVQESIDFQAPTFGVIMCIYHAVPQVDYIRTGMDFDISKVNVDDYANPAFDKLGLQGVNLNNFAMLKQDPSSIFAYSLRYYDYKSDLNDVKGIFRDSLEYQSYIAPVDLGKLNDFVNPQGDILNINYNFFKCAPDVLDPIFAVKANENVNTDTFICSAEFDIEAVRNLDTYGFPY